MTAETDVKTTVCSRHPETSTRLRCSQCDDLICPKCMVMCDVGIKCPSCIKQTTSHIMQVDKKHLITAVITGGLMGHAFGWAHPFLANFPFFYFFGIPVLGLFGGFLFGRFAGQLIRWSVQYKSGPVLSKVTAMSALIGLLVSPFITTVISWYFFTYNVLTNPYMSEMGTSSAFMFLHFGVEAVLVGLFIKGVQEAFKT